ncbi:MAG: hypothetical protein R3E85_13530, partial [Planctomycetota bacterium]
MVATGRAGGGAGWSFSAGTRTHTTRVVRGVEAETQRVWTQVPLLELTGTGRLALAVLVRRTVRGAELSGVVDTRTVLPERVPVG